ncbi:MAG TPA: hypothetical protein DD636_08705 [Anaerolineaceae bacterium]|jgi:hypothetical protein|nr:hypothetical protein [Anaerolineaceae bacterium]
MPELNDAISEYTNQLQIGQIQKAYKGIMSFMSALKTTLESRHPNYAGSGLYFGYMDMTYFAFTPLELKRRNLKIAIVYLHQENRFELWLGGSNRKVQSEYINYFKGKDLGGYMLSQVSPGVDSIIELIVCEQPDFEDADKLMKIIEEKTISFADQILSLLQN